MRRVSRILVLVAALLFEGALDARQVPFSEPLFVELPPGAFSTAWPDLDRSVHDRLFVGMRLDRVFRTDGLASRLLLDVGETRWFANYERVHTDGSGFRSWVGSIEGIDNSHVVITERGGVVSGLINARERQYQIRTAAPGVYLLERVTSDQLRYPDDALLPESSGEQLEPGLPQLSLSAPDVSGAIDVLMVYTPAARARFGVAQVEAIAAQVVSDTNTAFARSSVAMQFRTVGVIEIPLNEDVRMENDLRALTADLGPRLRTQYRADLVQLLEVSRDPNYCGIAWILTTQNATDFSSAFSVSDIGRAGCITQYTSTHEFGHNLGSAHDLANAGPGRLYPYSYGHQAPTYGFRSVMAYPCPTTRCDAIPNFSNPNVTQVGAPTGTASANNALSINNIAPWAANWRQSAVAEPPGVPTSLLAMNLADGVRLSWTASTSGGLATGFVLQVGSASGASDLFSGPVGPVPTVSGPVPPGRYYWRVIAVNASGSSTSAEAQFTVTGPLPPPAPTNLFSQVAGNTVTLLWSASIATPATSGYVLQVGRTSGASDIFNGAVGNRTSISGTVPSGTYFWRLIAVNAVGSSPPSLERQFTAGCTAPPGATRSLSFTRSARTVTLNWLAPLTGGPPTHYVIEVGSAPGLSNLLVFATGNTATFLTTQAPAGTFHVRVRAQNGCGAGEVSNEQIVTVP